MVKIIIVLIAIQYFMFLFTIIDKSVSLLARTRTCTHLSITVVKLIFTYLPRMVLRSFIRHNTTELFLFLS